MNTQINQSNQNITTKEEPDYRQLYEELQEQQQFTLSHVSHEIRNPVTLINSFLQLLESHHPELKEDKYWGKIMENMDFLKTLLNEFSSFNNSGKLNLQELDLSELLENLVASSLPTLENYNVSLVLNIEPNLPIIQADKTKISQLILNLLRNSSEAIKTKGVIHCSLTSQKNHLVLSIKDNGSGIPVLYQEDLFEPFITHKQEGTGLGLPICKRIAEAHNGSISFQSVPEKGTEFTVLLPIRQLL